MANFGYLGYCKRIIAMVNKSQELGHMDSAPNDWRNTVKLILNLLINTK